MEIDKWLEQLNKAIKDEEWYEVESLCIRWLEWSSSDFGFNGGIAKELLGVVKKLMQ